MNPSDYSGKQDFLFRHSDWWPPLLVVTMLISMWVGLSRWVESNDARVVHGAMVNQGNIAHGVANHISLLLNRIRIYHRAYSARGGDEAARAMVRTALSLDKSVLRLMYFDGEGRLLFTTGRRPEAWLLQAAKVFAEKAKEGTAVEIEIGTVPPLEYAHAWNLPIFVQQPMMGKRLDIFVLALVDLGDFSRRFAQVAIGKSGEISVVASDGRELLRLHEGRLDPVGTIAETERFKVAFGGDIGAVVEKSPSGYDRIYAYKKIPFSPLATFVSLYQGDVLKANQLIRRAYYGSAAILTLLVVVLTYLWMLAAKRRRLLIDSLTLSNENNERLIKQVERERQEAYRLATYDKLTGLPNRMLFADFSSRHVKRAQRTYARFAVLFIDLDRFKPVNDNYGHKVGDQLLIEVSNRLQDCVRKTDVVSRYGGDEFVTLAADLYTSQDAAGVAEKIIECLSRPFVGLVDAEILISPSIGIALYPDDADLVDTLVRKADAAMYLAKEKGRATYAFADDKLNRRMALAKPIERELPGAILAREIRLRYQPKVSLENFSITGLEALPFWDHPLMGHLAPDDFIPAAEKCDEISALGKYHIVEVIRQLDIWGRTGVPRVPVAVSVSIRMLCEPRIYDFISETLEQWGVAPHLLELEIVGDGLIDPGVSLLDTVNRLNQLGVEFVIGNGGQRLLSLTHQRILPAKYSKIEAFFIKCLRNNSKDAATVSNAISLSHNMKLITIAEGVENRDQLAYLKTARCEEASGPLFSLPLETAEAHVLLEKKSLNPL